jgi:transketolase
MALNANRLDRPPYRTYVLLGDSEMAEGSQWETIQLAAHYQAANLVGIIDDAVTIGCAFNAENPGV